MAWTWSWRWSSLMIGLLAHVLPKLAGGFLGPSQGLTPRPVCASQYALANYACSMIPYSPLSPRIGSAPPDDDDDRGLRHSHSHSHSHHHHRTRSSVGSSGGHGHGHSHHRRRHHRHRRSRDGGEGDDGGEDESDGDDDDDDENQGTPEEEDCCRWLSEMDNDCVCEMLVRLPDFLSRPVHQYTVAVGDSCNVTYSCGGRVIRK